ncbi:MAG: esterase family protein [Rubrobacter sp.]|nr:esterase family protein [Rubrobacter sp.]
MLATVGVGAFVGYNYCTKEAGEDTLYGCANDAVVNMYLTLWSNDDANQSDVSSKGTVETKTFYSQALDHTMQYAIYLPPGYYDLRHSFIRYPVVYLLPGASGSIDTWVKAGDMAEQMDSLLTQGQVQPMILVVPQESIEYYSNGGGVDGALGNWETYTAQDLVNEIDSNYRTIHSKEGRMIAGDSEGGYSAMNLGLRNPSEFGVIGSFSGTFTIDKDDLSKIFGGDQSLAEANSPMHYLPQLKGALPAIYLLVGEQDSASLKETSEFAQELKARNAPFKFDTFPGGHNWEFWRAHLPDLLIFAREHLSGGGG